MSLKEIIQGFFEELKKALQDYAQKQETALKARLRKILILSITGTVLLSLGISMAGTAALFFLVGSLRYLETFLPAWEAWMIMATTSAIVAAALFVTLILIIRKELSSTKTEATEIKQQTKTPIEETSQLKQEA